MSNFQPAEVRIILLDGVPVLERLVYRYGKYKEPRMIKTVHDGMVEVDRGWDYTWEKIPIAIPQSSDYPFE